MKSPGIIAALALAIVIVLCCTACSILGKDSAATKPTINYDPVNGTTMFFPPPPPPTAAPAVKTREK